MKFSTAFASALLAASVSAVPTKSHKKAHRHHSHPLILKDKSALGNVASNNTYDSSSGNWAGGIISPPDGQSFNAVSGKFVVPQPSAPDGASPGTYSGSAWVGIDGADYGGAILQSGATWNVDTSSGSPSYSYSVWTEWLPDASVNVDGFTVNAGDTISIAITASDNSNGQVVITDETSGQTVTTTLSAPQPTATLEGLNAEWIVEDFSINGGQAPFANFGTVKITDCAAATSQQQLDLTGGGAIDMVGSDGSVISDATVVSNTEVDVVYQ